MDGSARYSPGMARIGGVLRNCTGKVMCLFSLHIGIHDSNLAESRAIHKACEICCEARMDSDIEIVSDSTTAVSWVKNKDFSCLKHLEIIRDIRSMCNL